MSAPLFFSHLETKGPGKRKGNGLCGVNNQVIAQLQARPSAPARFQRLLFL